MAVSPPTSKTRGANTCTWPNGGLRRGGRMPTTCHGWPFSVIVSPISDPATAEARLPQLVADDADGGAVRLIFVGGEVAAARGHDAERREERSR